MDSFQGAEKDVIVVSCCRTGSTLGFLTSPCRLNVAITRARHHLIVVGRVAALTGRTGAKEGVKMWTALVGQAQVVAGRARGHSLDEYFCAAGDQKGLISTHMHGAAAPVTAALPAPAPTPAGSAGGGDGFPDAAEIDSLDRGGARLESDADDAVSIPSDVEW